MSERNAYDDVMGFFGQDAAGVISGRQTDPVSGKVKATFMDSLFGRSQSELDSAYDQMQTTTRRKKGKNFLEESGYTASELGLDPEATSVGSVQSAIRTLEEGKRDAKSDKAFQRSLQPMQMQMQQQANEFNATMQRSMAQDAKSHQLQLMQLADSRDARVAELEYQKIRDRKADLQYNERLEQMDRKDRRAAMQNLGAGLAALGAAFAL
jgi:hypothetical protein